MQIHISPDAEALGDALAQRIVAAVQANPTAVIGLATGSSPVAAYRAWGRIATSLGLDQNRVRGFALDEYIGLEAGHPESYHSVIQRDVVEVVGLDPHLVHVPNGNGEPGEAEAYDRAIREAGGIDVQILGIGRNGHLGFNEPGTAFDSRTHVVDLTAETIADNARFFASSAEVPTTAITQGLGTIFEARELVVIATGSAKAAAVAAALEGPCTEELPASLLQRHPNVHWFIDEDAASLLSGKYAEAGALAY
ncbi:glucosamine-6-phosphate deaminase [Leucobacter coleopterorum]|uniref:Glucosamine-6-phosphate deaminase n=1 Tax=Leucobacter coleopterorum TaxID=2714933 RepID=A0ABX6JYR2_9MICO|nr:glucosamine-6-phosphate deaminase [Leucobacter coleopterorum]QIM19464.1 glucosamine-6-phosphate deaminase [Leucobacter coleopterorum]